MFSAFYLVAVAGYAVIGLRLLQGLSRLRRQRHAVPAENAPGFPSITVMVAARNEEHNLPRTLDALLAQDYPAERLQILVANDRSTDGTGAVLRDYAARFPGRLEFVEIDSVPAGWAPKKNALRHGLERARGEWIAMTDADCVMGPGWLRALARHFSPDTGIVQGIPSYLEPEGGFDRSQGIQALNFQSHSVTAAALMGLDFPVISNANNLAYRRLAFDEAGGFESHGGVVSGDDDFLLQEIHATGKWKARFCVDPEARMRTNLPESWRQYWEQHKRWASKCLHYRAPQVAFLLVLFFYLVSIPALLVAGIWSATALTLGAVSFGVKLVVDYVVMRSGLKLFGLSPLLRFYLPTALIYIPLVVGAVIAGMTRGFTWKDQKLGAKV